jgi:hypothetical protein
LKKIFSSVFIKKKTMSEREKYFIEVQLKERECLMNLYSNYFIKRGCSNLYMTSLTGFSRYDATLKSGATDVVIEYKRRNISTTKYSDTFIEKGKFKELYQHRKDGKYTLFIVEYDDYHMLFDLSYHFLLYDCEYNDHHFFYPINATADMYTYANGQKEKDIRCLNYFDATYILNKEYMPCSYRHFLVSR